MELLQAAYWIERLTMIVQGQAQLWEEAFRWLVRLAELPTRYTHEITPRGGSVWRGAGAMKANRSLPRPL